MPQGRFPPQRVAAKLQAARPARPRRAPSLGTLWVANDLKDVRDDRVIVETIRPVNGEVAESSSGFGFGEWFGRSRPLACAAQPVWSHIRIAVKGVNHF
jgi:hypothetical protein